MPIQSSVFTLSDETPTLIVDADNMIQEVHLHNMSDIPMHYVHIGGSDLTLDNSLHLNPSESISCRLNPKDQLYAMSDPDGVKVGILRVVKNG